MITLPSAPATDNASVVDDIVGRDAELEAIECWLDARRAPTLLIEGEAGIGKSTLWRAGVELARAPARGL